MGERIWQETDSNISVSVYKQLCCYHAATHEPLDLYSDCQQRLYFCPPKVQGPATGNFHVAYELQHAKGNSEKWYVKS